MSARSSLIRRTFLRGGNKRQHYNRLKVAKEEEQRERIFNRVRSNGQSNVGRSVFFSRSRVIAQYGRSEKKKN